MDFFEFALTGAVKKDAGFTQKFQELELGITFHRVERGDFRELFTPKTDRTRDAGRKHSVRRPTGEFLNDAEKVCQLCRIYMSVRYLLNGLFGKGG